MPEVDTITVKGFKSIAAIEKLKLGAINVVIGPNGSGKSNFIGVFAFLHAIREGLLQDYVIKAGGADKVLHFGSKITGKLEIRASFQDGVNEYVIALEPTAADQLHPASETVSFWDKRHPATYAEDLAARGMEAGISDAQRSGTGAYVRQHLNRWRLYHFHDTSSTSPIKKTADLNDNRYLRPDGSNLAAFLYVLRLKHDTAYSLIRRTIQRVAPFFDDFVLEPQQLNPDKIRLEWRHKGSDAYFDASSLSDGTLRFIALATLFLQPDSIRPSLILVDEPELGLHPYAITLLASLVKQAAVTTQVILSTQSPLLLDHFQPEDVLVADRVGGGTRFTRLESARLASWLEDYSLGQLWEKNELGGRPSGE
ncbi:MAG: cytochrome c biogenesis protein CcmA [Candidatus Accumulibacter appositus]|uniref:Cytochrome c biogenesis protein CcmA n=1 Tax=Candidatus Accumulibacter appositus TaxID=1454003 RepID=A0A011N6D2_9PROT|nr:AAA family ATPase [Accumulibacter sp.]EXI78173.1 MAG: cytochrome c biogenesis protein CcmA [Candidatus Accumulibacter appositus]HRF04700.1 AAA family ATPase [Accumulibacter sp.]